MFTAALHPSFAPPQWFAVGPSRFSSLPGLPAPSKHAAAKPTSAIAGRGLLPGQLDELLRLARLKPGSAWRPGMHVSQAHNAHYTNTYRQIAYAFAHDYNSVEGDVRMHRGVPVMAHDRGRLDGLALAEWVRVVHTSGRLLRLDVKEAAALPSVLRVLRDQGVPAHQVSFNVSVLNPTGGGLTVTELRALRALYPHAPIGLSVPVPLGYVYEQAARIARAAGGGPFMVALHAQWANAATARRLQPALIVGAWNHPPLYAPTDLVAERARLRAMGIDGMIDLRRADDPLAED